MEWPAYAPAVWAVVTVFVVIVVMWITYWLRRPTNEERTIRILRDALNKTKRKLELAEAEIEALKKDGPVDVKIVEEDLRDVYKNEAAIERRAVIPGVGELDIGKVTLTPPSFSGDTVIPIGHVVRVNVDGNPKLADIVYYPGPTTQIW